MNTNYLYYKVRRNLIIERTIYIFITLAIFISIFTLSLKLWIKYDGALMITGVIFTFVFFIALGVFMWFFIWNIVLYIKNEKIVKYYKNVNLENIKEVILDYDAKLWLTAPKDTFHPLSGYIDNEAYKSLPIFTNSEKYGYVFKHNMPKQLVSRFYMDAYTKVGYDKIKKEYIIIDYRRL